MLLTRFLFSSQLNGCWTIPKIGLNFLMNQLIDCTNLVASCGGGKIGLDRGDDRWAEHLDEGLRLRFPVLPPPWHVGVDILSWICSRQHSQNWKLHRTAILVWFESKRTETSRQIKKFKQQILLVVSRFGRAPFCCIWQDLKFWAATLLTSIARS